MKHSCYTIIFLCSCLSFLSCSALGLFDAARDTVEGAAQVTQDALNLPSNVVEGAAGVTSDVLQTTGDVAEDVLTPVRRREGMYQEMPVEGEPYPENDDVYIPQSPQRVYQDE